MTTSIKINIEGNNNKYFSEDSVVGVERAGKAIVYTKATSNASSGIKKVFSDHKRSTIFVSDVDENGKIIAKNRFKAFDQSKIRQGVEVRGMFDIRSDNLPFISVGNKSPFPFNARQKMQPSFDEDFYGVPSKINRETFIPFEDISRFNPSKRLNITNVNNNKMYPVFTGSHYNDEFILQATLEPFEIRKRKSDRRMIEYVTHVSDRGFFSGVRGKLMGGGFEESEKGSVIIRDVYPVTNKSDDILKFDDTRHVNRLVTTHLPINFKESSGKVELKPFNDRLELSLIPSGTSYSFMTDTQISTLYENSVHSLSTIGTIEISATAGFVYESTSVGNTTLGTDSIAFGGFNRSDPFKTILDITNTVIS